MGEGVDGTPPIGFPSVKAERHLFLKKSRITELKPECLWYVQIVNFGNLMKKTEKKKNRIMS